MKSTLDLPKLCKACQMELLPYKDEYGDIVHPQFYCDFKCEKIYKLYRKAFIRPEYCPYGTDTRKIDLSL